MALGLGSQQVFPIPRVCDRFVDGKQGPMTIPAQSIVAGCLQTAFHRALEYFLENRVLERLWAKDATLWPEEQFEHSHILSNLEWLVLFASLEPLLDEAKKVEASAVADGFDCRVLIAFDTANLAIRALLPLVPPGDERRVVVIDSTCPVAISRAESEINLRRSLFVFAGKAGYRLEDHALLLYFMDRLQSSGVPEPSQQFVAATEPGSYLATLAREYNFRNILPDQPGILSPYYSVLYVGAFLTTLFNMKPAAVAAAAK
jgi:hypothetical protein